MNWSTIGLGVAVALPLSVVIGMIFWPSDYND